MKLNANNFSQELEKVLEKYQDEERQVLNEEIERAAKETQTKIKENAKREFKGNIYYKSWRYDLNKGRLNTTATVYSKNRYQIAHLLENGHANRTGGWTNGRPHIAPAAEEAEQELLQRLEQRL